MDGRDPDFAAKARGGEGGLEISHRRKELRDENLVAEGEDLVADGDEGDLAGGVEGEDVRVDPLSGGVGIGSQAGDVAGTDDDLDAGAGEGGDDGRIGAVEADPLDRSGAEEVGSGRRRREVVGDLAVVDADEGLRLCKTDKDKLTQKGRRLKERRNGKK